MKAQQTGMTGVFLVAAELSSRGMIVSPTSRSAMGADILVTDQSCANSFSIQVKTNSKKTPYWLLSKKNAEISSPSHVYVFVNLDPKADSLEADYYIVPSKVVKKHVYVGEHPKSTMYSFNLKHAQKYKDAWTNAGCEKGS